ncbi:MAG: Ig-like domain-containing protein [Promethearchaeota archaeon]
MGTKYIAICILTVFLIGILPSTSFQLALSETKPASKDIQKLDPKFAIDTGRVDYRYDHFPNRGFELWDDLYDPAYLSTSETTETDTWYATAPDPVNEGSRSIALEARAVDESLPAIIRLSQQIQIYWDNPTNLTLSFDWWLDELPSPIDADHFEVNINMGAGHLFYYLGCQQSKTNTSSNAYFNVSGSLHIWNRFSRNLTSDYIEAFGTVPTSYETISLSLRSYTDSYSRIFLDDLNLVNGTTVKIGGANNNGNFESTASWTFTGRRSPGQISKSSVSKTGNWSLNATVMSDRSRQAYTSFDTYISKRLTDLNQDQFSFWWRIDEWENVSTHSYAYLNIVCKNSTSEFNLYYMLAHDGSTPYPNTTDDLLFFVDDFNTTDAWNSFNTSIWDTTTSHKPLEELFIESVRLFVYTQDEDSRLTVLIDDMSFVSVALNDMSYEDQFEIGSPIHSWGGFDLDEHSEYSVTDFAYTGNKAANLTLIEGGLDSYWNEYYMSYRPLNETTELILDLMVYIETFNYSSEDDCVMIEVSFEDENFYYYLANGSAELSEDENYILLQDIVPSGSWTNLQLDLAHDYESLFGAAPNTTLGTIYIGAECYNGNLTVFFDDLYLYEDPAPGISNVQESAEAGEPVVISANVIDATLSSVELYYSVDSGAWTNLSMSVLSGDQYQAAISSLVWNTVVDYYINATDAFGKTTLAPQTGYYSLTVEDTIAPSITFNALTNGSTVSGIVEIRVSASDQGSGVKSMNISIDGISVLNDTLSQNNVSWDTATVVNGAYIISVTVHDNTGNSAQSALNVTVDNETPVDFFPLIILGAVLVGGVAIIVIVYILREKGWSLKT